MNYIELHKRYTTIKGILLALSIFMIVYTILSYRIISNKNYIIANQTKTIAEMTPAYLEYRADMELLKEANEGLHRLQRRD